MTRCARPWQLRRLRMRRVSNLGAWLKRHWLRLLVAALFLGWVVAVGLLFLEVLANGVQG